MSLPIYLYWHSHRPNFLAVVSATQYPLHDVVARFKAQTCDTNYFCFHQCNEITLLFFIKAILACSSIPVNWTIFVDAGQ